MCTVVVSLAPEDQVSLLLLGIRDEFTGRPWRPPARHWPGSPLIGGRDLQAGGTWLAVDPGVPRVACVLNGRGPLAPADTRRSRGELPLQGPDENLAVYDPFHLVTADTRKLSLLSWDGSNATRQELPPGTHVITNAGLDPDDPKAAYFAPRFAAQRPPAEPAMGITEAWEPWLTLVSESVLPVTDQRAIRVSRQLPDGRWWGTTSISLVALSSTGLRYDFASVPGGVAPVKA